MNENYDEAFRQVSKALEYWYTCSSSLFRADPFITCLNSLCIRTSKGSLKLRNTWYGHVISQIIQSNLFRELSSVFLSALINRGKFVSIPKMKKKKEERSEGKVFYIELWYLNSYFEIKAQIAARIDSSIEQELLVFVWFKWLN